MITKIITVSQLFESLETVLVPFIVILSLLFIKCVHINLSEVGEVQQVVGERLLGAGREGVDDHGLHLKVMLKVGFVGFTLRRVGGG